MWLHTGHAEQPRNSSPVFRFVLTVRGWLHSGQFFADVRGVVVSMSLSLRSDRAAAFSTWAARAGRSVCTWGLYVQELRGWVCCPFCSEARGSKVCSMVLRWSNYRSRSFGGRRRPRSCGLFVAGAARPYSGVSLRPRVAAALCG